jgi:hypothetical protein
LKGAVHRVDRSGNVLFFIMVQIATLNSLLEVTTLKEWFHLTGLSL